MSVDIKLVELVNVILVISLFVMLSRRRDVAALLLVSFAYGTLHFGFAAAALASTDRVAVMTEMHLYGGGALAKLSALSLIGVVFFLLGGRAYKNFLLNREGDKIIIVSMLLVMLAIFAGYLFNMNYGDWLQLKNVISLIAMFAFALIAFLAMKGEQAINIERGHMWGVVGVFMFGVVDCIAIYEVFSHTSWAGTMSSAGVMVYRSSSILFNPNLLGFWASLMYMGFAYGFEAYKQNRKIMLWGMVLSSVALYFSGSRSSGYLLLAALFAPTALLFLLRRRLFWLPLMMLPLTMLAIYAGAAWMAPLFVTSTVGWHEIALLGERFGVALVQLINYQLGSAPSEIVVSIEGRFVGELRDSGWLVLYQDTGWFGLWCVVMAVSMLFTWGVRVCVTKPCFSNSYAFAALLFCILSGFVMRFQIFPVWLFDSLVLVACLALWSRPEKLASNI
jgi:hypothetical protein